MSVSGVEIVKTIELEFAKMELRNDSIITFLPNSNYNGLTITQIDEIYEAILKLNNNKPTPLFVDLVQHAPLSSDVKSSITSKLPLCLTACAIKEDNIMIRFVVHAYNHLYKPEIPIKMFKTKEEAILWLTDFC